MKILTFNVGSTSIKYALYEDNNFVEGYNYENIKNKENRLNVANNIINKLRNQKIKPQRIIHRVVHGKDIKEPKLITNKLIQKLEDISQLAPLHLIPEIDVIKVCKENYKCKQFAVFDTSFYSNLPIHTQIYGLPYKYFKKGIKKYGFHGISHKFVTRNEKGKVISFHLGGGCSITAVKNGFAVDTTMGFTPLEGLIMATRSGSLDPAIIPHIIKNENVSIDEVSNVLNKESGLLGISGKTSDMKVLLENKDERSKLAIDVFCYKARKHFLGILSNLNGIDTIIFTGGIGQNSSKIRSKILSKLDFLGIEIDEKLNRKNKDIISSKSSRVIIKVKKTNEEKAMILECINK
ncbi:MAG: acetate/propionate family kinase [Candidatus Woesearchaeota archaeon]